MEDKIIGFEFETEKTDGILTELFKGVRVEEYDWYFDEYSAYVSHGNEITDADLESSFVSGNSIKNVLDRISEHSIVFMVLQLFKQGTARDNAVTYSEYENSNCEAVVIITDSCLIEVYAKGLLNCLYENGKTLSDSIEYKTVNSDGRMTFQV